MSSFHFASFLMLHVSFLSLLPLILFVSFPSPFPSTQIGFPSLPPRCVWFPLISQIASNISPTSPSNKQLHYSAWKWGSARDSVGHLLSCICQSHHCPLLHAGPWLGRGAVRQTILRSRWLCMQTSKPATPSPSQSCGAREHTHTHAHTNKQHAHNTLLHFLTNTQ